MTKIPARCYQCVAGPGLPLRHKPAERLQHDPGGGQQTS
jgi:hypothetical protein